MFAKCVTNVVFVTLGADKASNGRVNDTNVGAVLVGTGEISVENVVPATLLSVTGWSNAVPPTLRPPAVAPTNDEMP